MRRLLLLRHAKAERSDPGTQDRARVLIERGRKDAAKIGAYMASHALLPDHVVLSPAARARETWKYLGDELKSAPAAISVERLYAATPRDIIGVVKGTPTSAQIVLLIGHNPGLHDAALTLIASGDIDTRERLREGLPTTGLVIVDFAFDNWGELHPQSGRLERFVSPKSLDAAASI